VLSISSGTVVALATDWVPGSILRGGRYVYVYDPMRSSLFYYAHLRSLHVELGDIVSPGQAIATVGRSGRNAIANAPPRDVSGHRRRCSTSARHLSRPAPAGAPAGRRLKASLCFASIPPSESSRQGRRRQPNEDASPSSGTSQRSQPFTPGRRDSAVILIRGAPQRRFSAAVC